MRFFKIPAAVRYCFPKCTWRLPASGKVIYLTFDDGPIPRHTEFILKTLDEYDAKATFFCVGDNLRKHPAIAVNIAERGHVIGNHTCHHLKAWKTGRLEYLNDIALFEKEYARLFGGSSRTSLFRPPHGQLTPALYRALTRMNYKIVMWDLLSYDFDAGLNAEKAGNVLKSSATEGSIVVFHDNYKAENNLRHMLPAFLSHFSKKGFRFNALERNIFN